MNPKLDMGNVFSSPGLDVSKINTTTTDCYTALFQADPSNKKDDFFTVGTWAKDFITAANIDDDKAHLSLAEVMKKLNLGDDPKKLDDQQKGVLGAALTKLAFFTTITSTLATQEPPMGDGGAITPLKDTEIPASMFAKPTQAEQAEEGTEEAEMETSPEQIQALIAGKKELIAAQGEESRKMILMIGGAALLAGIFIYSRGKAKGRVEAKLEAEARPAELIGPKRRLLALIKPETAYGGMFRKAEGRVTAAKAEIAKLEKLNVSEEAMNSAKHDLGKAERQASFYNDLMFGKEKLPVLTSKSTLITLPASLLGWGYTIYYAISGQAYNQVKEIYALITGKSAKAKAASPVAPPQTGTTAPKPDGGVSK
jgi:hypothetical protein